MPDVKQWIIQNMRHPVGITGKSILMGALVQYKNRVLKDSLWGTLLEIN